MCKEKLLCERDLIIRMLWTTFNKLSYETDVEDWSEEDLDLWSKITAHTSIQNILKENKNI